jgi:hypothetical protein
MNGTQWDGSTWGPTEIAMSSSARVVNEEMFGGAVTLPNDDIVFSMLTSGAPIYIKVVRRYASNSSWGTPRTVFSDIVENENPPGPSVPSISRDGNDLYLFFQDWPAADTGFFAYYNSAQGLWDSQPTFFFTDTYLNNPETIASWFSVSAGGKLGVVEVNGTVAPNQELRFVLLNLPFKRYNVTFASRGIGSDTGNNPVVTVGATGYSMAGVTLNESQLPYQAVFYRNFHAAYNYSSSVIGASYTYSWSSIRGCRESAQSATFTVTARCTLTATYSSSKYSITPPTFDMAVTSLRHIPTAFSMTTLTASRYPFDSAFGAWHLALEIWRLTNRTFAVVQVAPAGSQDTFNPVNDNS